MHSSFKFISFTYALNGKYLINTFFKFPVINLILHTKAGQKKTVQYTCFGIFMFSSNRNSSDLSVLPSHWFSLQSLPQIWHLSYCGMKPLFPVDSSLCPALSTILPQLFPHHNHSAVNSPDIIKISVGY
jgi:hypothetical protein